MHNQPISFLNELQPLDWQRQHVVLPPPRVEPIHEVFVDAMLDESSVRQRRSPLDWAVSLVIHVAVLATLLILPLYFTNGLDVHRLNMTFLAGPPAAAPPPPPPPIAAAAPRVVHNVQPRAFVPTKLMAPAFIPKVVARMPSDAAAPDVAGVVGGVPGGMPGGEMGGVIGGVIGGALASAPPPVAPVAEGPKKPVRVGGSVKPPRLIYGPDPIYPNLAKQAKIFGVVVIEAIIDEHGHVTGMRAISGQPILIPAALSAVSKRVYEPTVLDGEATPIDLKVEITFSLG